MKNLKFVLWCFVLALYVGIHTQCQNAKKERINKKPEIMSPNNPEIVKSEFGKMPNGSIIEQFTLKNAHGVEVNIITYGGRITALKVPDKNGKLENVVLGHDNLSDYLRKDNPYFGALIGRYGNRIAKGKFTLNGKTYTLATNNGYNHLHGGVSGFDRAVWKATAMQGSETAALKLTYVSIDGEEGYPGTLQVAVIYTLTNDNSLEVAYEATTDKATVVNLTQHAYFNLTGDFSTDILSHDVVIAADTFLPVDATLIPTGEIQKVAGTPFDFNNVKKIGKDINADNEQLKLGNGFDHCWVLNGKKGDMRFVASAYEEISGRFMEVYSEEPGMQFYTGNFLNGKLPIPTGGIYKNRAGFCFETQHYPDAPNQNKFPSPVLNPGDTYKTKTTFKFSIK